MNFLAIDFETANRYRNSACAIGLVKVEKNKVVYRESFLIKPPQNYFEFTNIHGISWDDVKNEPTFNIIWKKIRQFFHNAEFIVAHNSSFDKSVLNKTCEHYNIELPKLNYQCTVKLSRELWNIYPTTLPDVCNYFRIPLIHHDALSDTEACAKIMIKAVKENKYNYEHA